MITIGVTGKMGSGKSLVCSMLGKLGATIFYSDAVAKEILNTDDGVKFKIRFAFGSKCYDEDGILDRKYLASKVFGDPDELETLNTIVHPMVYHMFNEEKKNDHKVLVMESAIIYKTRFSKNLDKILYVNCKDEVFIKRAMDRDNCSREKIEERIKHQTETADKADYVIDNTDISKERLLELVTEFYNTITNP